LDLAVWQEVCARLAHPRRLAEEYQRRMHPDSPTTRTTLTTLEAQLGKRRPGLARWIDRDTEALIEKHAFEPRLTRLRQRIAQVPAPRQHLAEADALTTDLRLMIGRLEDVAAQVQEGLTEADWSRKREMIRTLVKRVEVAHDQVRVVFRLAPRSGDPSPEKKSLQDCRRSQDPTLRRPHLGQLPLALFHHPRLEPLPDELQHPSIAHASSDQAHEQGVIDGVEGVVDVRIHHPPSPDEGVLDSFYGMVGTTLGSKAVGGVREVGLADGLDHDLARLLHHPISHRGNPSGALPTVRLGDVHSQHGLRAICPGPQVLPDLLHKLLRPLAFHLLDGDAIHPGRSAVDADLLPGPPQDIGPDEAVIQRVQPSVPAPLGCQVESALELS
jgi:hypothetical protein